ncbi:rhomboid family intramembrane serine protease [Lacisediminihabitans sp. H27-G8]|uniref:rhomboid family intramembrane serine protease n=1 Tax=Lacisediminihabitans sp. H27-G8 TaxID=3111909 RepID=UPI0038FC3908
MSEESANADDFCYRHPDRQSFILCQRCGRTICAECQTPAAVGVHCPECMRESRQSAPRTKPAVVTSVRRMAQPGAPLVTYVIMALCVIVFAAEALTGQLVGRGSPIVSALLYYPPYTSIEPWRMLTSLFVHGSIIHILFNMYSLFVLGPELERLVGRWRFLALFLLSGFGGSVAVLLSSPGSAVIGASGAIFGLFGAYFVIARHLGGNSRQLIIVIVINLVIGFIVPGIAWQAHVGGLLVGALVAFVLVRTRERSRRGIQLVSLAGVFVVLIGATFAGAQLIGA